MSQNLSNMSPALVTKALLRAAQELGAQDDLAQMLDLEASTALQLQSGELTLDPQSPEWTKALQVIGLFRSLVTLVGSPQRARDWLSVENQALAAAPIELLRTTQRDRVFRYLDAVQKHELRMPPQWRAE